MDTLREQLRRSERPIYYMLKEEVGETLHILVGMLALEKKNISEEHKLSKEQVNRVIAAVEETAGIMQPPRDYSLILERAPDGIVRH